MNNSEMFDFLEIINPFFSIYRERMCVCGEGVCVCVERVCACVCMLYIFYIDLVIYWSRPL